MQIVAKKLKRVTDVRISKRMSEKKRTVRLNVSLDEGDYRAVIVAARVTSRKSLKYWVGEAIKQKLEREAGGEREEGVLRDLSADDRRMVEDLADILRKHPEDTRLREVIRAQRGVLRLFLP